MVHGSIVCRLPMIISQLFVFISILLINSYLFYGTIIILGIYTRYLARSTHWCRTRDALGWDQARWSCLIRRNQIICSPLTSLSHCLMDGYNTLIRKSLEMSGIYDDKYYHHSLICIYFISSASNGRHE